MANVLAVRRGTRSSRSLSCNRARKADVPLAPHGSWPTSAPLPWHASRPASASSIGCSEVALSPARWCSSAARRGSASRRSPTWPWAILRRQGTGRCTSARRSPPSRSACEPSGLAPCALCGSRSSPRPTSTLCSRRSPPQRPAVCVIDSVQTLHAAELDRRAGLGGPGARGRWAPDGTRQVPGRGGDPGGSRHQGGRARRSARAGAPGGLRFAVRGRARAPLPRAARAEEPLRLHQRGGPVRDAPGRPRRGARRLRALRRRGHARARQRSCWRRWRARGRCSWRSRRWWRPPSWSSRGAWSRASIATASRSCWRSSGATDVWAPAGPTYSSTSSAASASMSPAWTSRSRSPSPSASRGVPIRGAHPPAPRACFGELGLTGELRWVGHPERRLQEAAKHGLRDVVAPSGSGAGAREAATLREALAQVLPVAGRARPRAAA